MSAFDSSYRNVGKGTFGSGIGGFTSGIDDLRVLATEAGLHPLISYVLGTVPVVSKWLTILEMRMYREDHEISLTTRRRVDEIVATVSTSTNQIDNFEFFLWGENYCSV